MAPITCQNCGNAFEGSFCNQCGQRDIANQRLKWREVINDFLDNFFNLDKGFVFTFWQLLVKPGKIGRSYIQGERKKYTNPVRYLIIAIAVQAFMDYWFLQAGPDPHGPADFFTFSFLSDEMNIRMARINLLLATKYIFVHYLSMILLFPAIFYLIFRKLAYRYIELLTINFYYFATSLMIILSILLIGYIMNIFVPVPLIIIVTMIYIFWCHFQFFREVRIVKRIILLFISIFLFMFLRIFLLIYLIGVFYMI